MTAANNYCMYENTVFKGYISKSTVLVSTKTAQVFFTVVRYLRNQPWSKVTVHGVIHSLGA